MNTGAFYVFIDFGLALGINWVNAELLHVVLWTEMSSKWHCRTRNSKPWVKNSAVRVNANMGDAKTFLLHEKSSCRAVGNDVRMFQRAHARIWGVFRGWPWNVMSGTGLGTKLAVIRGLPEESSSISGNYSLALHGRCLWRLCAGFCYQEQSAGRGEPRISSISCGFLT